MKKYKTTPYQRGRAFEYRVRNHLIKLGYTAWRSYASRGPYDIRAWKIDCPLLFIEVKSKKKYMSELRWGMLNKSAERAGAIPLLAYRTRRGRERPIIFEREDGERYDINAT